MWAWRMPVLHGVVMYVVKVRLKLVFVVDRVLPETPLPNVALAMRSPRRRERPLRGHMIRPASRSDLVKLTFIEPMRLE